MICLTCVCGLFLFLSELNEYKTGTVNLTLCRHGHTKLVLSNDLNLVQTRYVLPKHFMVPQKSNQSSLIFLLFFIYDSSRR